jgi:hypothetical protein
LKRAVDTRKDLGHNYFPHGTNPAAPVQNKEFTFLAFTKEHKIVSYSEYSINEITN